MRCLVTGGAGFIGSNLVDGLIRDRHEVVIIDDCSANNENFYWNERAEHHQISICDESSFDLYRNIDVVFHMAAESRIQPSIHDPMRAVDVNSAGTARVLENSRKNGVKRVVYSSTSSVYGLNGNYQQKEEDLIDCQNPYSFTKYCGEEFCRMYTKTYGLDTVILRYFNVYGNRSPSSGLYNPVVGIFLRQKKEGVPLTIVSPGTQKRDYINVLDVVSANIAVGFSSLRGESGVYNVASGKNYTIFDIAGMVLGKSIVEKSDYLLMEKRSGEVDSTLGRIDKIEAKYGWKPFTEFKTWIESEIS